MVILAICINTASPQLSITLTGKRLGKLKGTVMQIEKALINDRLHV